tara:strand:- start:11054 stop:12577 length:1524 start_codon:yes stop_codon:yes gene_type:complete
MSYYSAIRKGKAAAIQSAMDDAKTSMLQDISSDQAYRELLVGYIESMNTEIREYDKMLLELGVSKDDPAQLRRTVTRTYQSGTGHGKDMIDILDTLGTLSDKKAQRLEGHYIEQMKKFTPPPAASIGSLNRMAGGLDTAFNGTAGLAVKTVASRTNMFAFIDASGAGALITNLATADSVESKMAGAVKIRQSLEEGLLNKGFDPDWAVAYMKEKGIEGIVQHADNPWQNDDDFQDYVNLELRGSPADVENLQYAIDEITKISEDPDSKIPLVSTGTSTKKTEEKLLTDEALEVRERRKSIEFKALRKALFDDGEISDIEEEAWRKVRTDGDTRTLGDLRLEFLDDVQLENLEKKGSLSAQRERLVSERDTAREAQSGMGAPVRYDQKEIDRRAAMNYAPSAAGQTPLGRLGPSDRKALRAMDAARRGMVSTNPQYVQAANQVSKTTPPSSQVSEVERLAMGLPKRLQEAFQEGVLSIIMGGVNDKRDNSEKALGNTDANASTRSDSE